jgi:2-polyprenyl-6-methoxyphenol hydroxylase-like FAD-dependent oxidoreductase
MNIVCVGGGPAGLFFSILVKQQHPEHELTVLERSPDGDTYGWGVVFWDDLLDEVRAADPETARELAAHAFRWGSERLVVERKEPVTLREHGYAIGRRRLLELLRERATRLGVRVQFDTPVERPSELRHADLIAACDGANSRLRRLLSKRLGTRFQDGRNKYIWLGTTKVFDAFTFAFAKTPVGRIWCHAYGFDRETSTFIVECSARTWSRLGFGRIGQAETLRLLERIFEPQLDGHRLRANGSARWRTFRTIENESWQDGNVVLLGDAAHTTHFTIGSGTKLALEDAIALAAKLRNGGALQARLQAYERERKAAVRPWQTDASFSARWFENVDRYAKLDPVRFFALMHERRSPLLPRCPPRLYYRLHQVTHDIKVLRTLRRRVAPRIKALY